MKVDYHFLMLSIKIKLALHVEKKDTSHQNVQRKIIILIMQIIVVIIIIAILIIGDYQMHNSKIIIIIITIIMIIQQIIGVLDHNIFRLQQLFHSSIKQKQVMRIITII